MKKILGIAGFICFLGCDVAAPQSTPPASLPVKEMVIDSQPLTPRHPKQPTSSLPTDQSDLAFNRLLTVTTLLSSLCMSDGMVDRKCLSAAISCAAKQDPVKLGAGKALAAVVSCAKTIEE